MTFKTYAPCDELKPYVRSFGIQETATATVYKVLPGTSLVIGFQYKGAVSSVLNLKETPLSAYGITGMPDSFSMFRSIAGTSTVLIFFRVAGAAVFFNESLHEFAGKSVSLDNFIIKSELSLLQERLQEADCDMKRIHLVEEFLLSRIMPGSRDELVLEAIRHIEDCKGDIKIRELTGRLFISKSPFEKRFRKIVGTSPKKFASLVRFKDILTGYRPNQSFTEMAHGAGFFDQSHFIKQFKIYTGETPEIFFNTPK